MKIHSLHIRNLNSLVGDWSIDFSDPMYEETGFFAITGPTGAGKSTILDAICLALYGKTPRLGKISQTSNAIMSTNTGECLAEVVFSTGKGRFRSIWRQNRAHKRPDRDLQAPTRELSFADTNTLIETKTKEIEHLIEEFTGMDFDRFTRTMLLAQGSFTAFLLAPVRERSNILEEITGTSIYSDLSKLVFERSKLEDSKLSSLQKDLGEMKCLKPEEESLIQDEINGLNQNIVQTDSDIKNIGTQIQWLKTLLTLQQELEKAQQASKQARDEYDAFEIDQKRLTSAKRAQLIEGAYTLLKTHRQERDLLSLQLSEEEQKVPTLRMIYDQALFKEEETKRTLEEIICVKEQDTKIARDVRVLISGIQQKKEDQIKKETEIKDQEEEIKKGREEIIRLDKLCKQTEEGIRNADQYIRGHSTDIRLSEDYSLAVNIYTDIEKCSEQLGNLNSNLALLKTKEKRATEENIQYQQEIRTYEEKIAGLSDHLSSLEMRTNTLLDGLPPDELNTKINNLTIRMKDLADLQKMIRSLSEKQKICASKQDQILQNSNLINKNESDRASQITVESQLAEGISILEKEVFFIQQVISAEEIRNRLEDGKACPVCGSLHHPYAEGNVPEIGKIETDLMKKRSELVQLRELISGHTNTITSLSSQNDSLSLEIEERGEEIQRELLQIQETASGLSLVLSTQDWIETAQEAFICADHERENFKGIEAKLRSISEDLNISRRSRDVNQENITLMKEKSAKSQQEQIAILRDCENAEMNIITITRDLEDKTSRLNKICSQYGYQESHNYKTTLQDLSERKSVFAEYKLSIEQLSPRLSALGSDVRNKNERLKEREITLQRLKEEIEEISENLRLMNQRRFELYADKDPDTEENRLKSIESDLKSKYVAATKKREEQSQSLRDLEAKIQHIKGSLNVLIQKIEIESNEFLRSLKLNEFSSEEEYVSVLLPTAIVQELEETGKRLNMNKIASDSLAQEKMNEYNRIKELNQTEESLDNLTIWVEQRKGEIIGLQNQVFSKQHILNENTRKGEEADVLKVMISEQVREQIRWSKMNKLIGSSDGTKFRSFAQGLTLTVLLSFANIHLQKLTDRYYLTTRKESPLEIHVIDNYRAGEIRVTQNLSGGESFIVSLALALGLSAMSSRNVRVDSLFLDEGFGTLDDDSLDLALSTLAGMKQEGKLIGVISHVQSLKERIQAQIVVERLSGGRSRISGPGCRKV